MAKANHETIKALKACIDRQQAEIERLQGWQDLLKAEKHSLIEYGAIREFAKKLKKRKFKADTWVVSVDDIDRLTKETIGSKKGV